MGPKKKAEAPPEDVVDNSAAIQQFQASVLNVEEGEEIAVQVMQEIVHGAEDLMVSNYLDRTAIPYTIQDVAKEILDLIQFMFVAHDTGDIDEDVTASWLPDEEPPPVVADSWARGAIPTRRRSPPPTEQTAPDMPRMMSMLPRGQRSMVTEPKPDHPMNVEEEKKPETPIKSKAPKPRPKRATERSVIIEDTEIDKKAMSLDEGLLEAQETMRQLQLEQQRKAEMQERIEQQVRALRQAGRDFTVDSVAGKVIPVQVVDVRRLPHRAVDVKVRIEGDSDEEATPVKEEARRKVTSWAPPRGEKKKKREPRIPSGTYLPLEESAGPMVEDIHPAGGVILRDGDRVVRAELKAPKDRPSKADYKKEQESRGLGTESFFAQQEAKKALERAHKTPPPKAPSPGTTLATPPTTSAVMAMSVMKSEGGRKLDAQYRPQEVAPVPSHRIGDMDKEGPGHHARNPRRRGASKTPTSTARSLSPEHKHWTASSFTAAGSPAAPLHLPELSNSIIRNEQLANQFVQSIYRTAGRGAAPLTQ